MIDVSKMAVFKSCNFVFQLLKLSRVGKKKQHDSSDCNFGFIFLYLLENMPVWIRMDPWIVFCFCFVPIGNGLNYNSLGQLPRIYHVGISEKHLLLLQVI